MSISWLLRRWLFQGPNKAEENMPLVPEERRKQVYVYNNVDNCTNGTSKVEISDNNQKASLQILY